MVEVEFDLVKSELNRQRRGLPFSVAESFDFETALYRIDARRDYGEVRIQAVGMIDARLHVLVFTETASGIRVISLRKANHREAKRYEQETAQS